MRAVAAQLDVPVATVNLERTYWNDVFQPFLDDVSSGVVTPNPDVACNRHVKFGALLHHCREQLGADLVATGHYARVDVAARRLVRGVDRAKDQTYFLSRIHGAVLDRVRFPVGHLTKDRVRRIALERDLPTATARNSVGICFIGKRKFSAFLKNYIDEPCAGDFVRLDDGRVVGSHTGLPFYTIGQGARISGLTDPGQRYFVQGKDAERNVVYVVEGKDNPALFTTSLTAKRPSWISGTAPPFGSILTSQCRYLQRHAPCRIAPSDDAETLRIEFDAPQRGVTPGQIIALYDGEHVAGGAIIDSPGAPCTVVDPAAVFW